MTTKEHVKALELQAKAREGVCDELRQTIDRMRETIQHERRWRQEAEADAGRLREALRRVEWVSGWDVEGHKAIYCPWCNRIKGFGHAFGCIRQAALSPTEQADDEKGVKG